MLSKRFYRTVAIFVPKFSYLGAYPYTWDAAKQIFVPLNKKYGTHKKMLISNIFVLIWFLFLLCQVTRYLIMQNYNMALYLITMTFVMGCELIVYTMVILEADDFFPMVNSTLIFLRWMNSKPLIFKNGVKADWLNSLIVFFCILEIYLPSHVPEKSKAIMYFDLFVVLAYIVNGFFYICISAFFIAFPTFPNLFGSIFPTSILWITFCSCVQLYFVFLCCCQFTYLFVSSAAYGIVLMPLLIQEFRLGRKSYKSIDLLREPAHLSIAYRANQIFHIKLNNCMGKILFPSQTMSTLLFIFCCYMLMRLRGVMEPMQICIVGGLGGVSAVFWSSVLIIFGHIHLNGSKILSSWKRANWKNRKNRIFMDKFRLSCKPIMICWEKRFVVRKTSLLLYLRGLTRGLVRCLLSLDKRMKT